MVKKHLRRNHSTGNKIKAYFYWFFGLTAVVLIGFFVWTNKQGNTPCANSISCIKDLTGAIDPSQKEGEFMGQKIQVPQEIAQSPQSEVVLGDSSSNKHIYIDLTNQKLIAKEGDTTVFEFLISSGKWGKTPTGEFSTWIKLRATRMEGGNPAFGTYYNLPNVPYTMYFYGEGIPKYLGFGIHGAYWHNNFGHPMSHGCINMRIEDAGVLFNWANPPSTGYTTYVNEDSPGTPITIYGVAPPQ